MVALFVVLTFLLFILIDFLVLRAEGKVHPAFVTMRVFDKGSLFLPSDVLLSKGHLWLKRMQEGIMKIGIDEFAMKALGNVKLNNIHQGGSKINKGDILFTASAGNKTISFVSPVSGTVQIVNNNLAVKKVSDPYGDDWGLTIKPDNNSNENLFTSHDKAVTWMHDEFTRFKEFLISKMHQPALAGVTMMDGGNIVEGALVSLDEETIKLFEKEFLSI